MTPGGIGVTQVTDVAALNDVADTATATAYSSRPAARHTAWNVAVAVAVAIAIVVVKVDEQKAQRAAKCARR